MATLHLVMPALDETANIARVLDDIRAARERLEFDLCVILVDDGSTDGTAEAARAAADGIDLEVMRHASTRGPGAAFATGFASLNPLQDEDLVLTLEADNTSRLELLDQMVRRARDEGYDAVFASAYAYGGGVVHTNALRTGLSHLANTFVKEFLGIHGLLTVSSFYRLYRGSAIRELQQAFGPGIVERAGFECMVELTLKLMYLDMSISEVAMVLDSSRRVGKSKMRVMQAGVGYVGLFRRKGTWRALARAEVKRGARRS